MKPFASERREKVLASVLFRLRCVCQAEHMMLIMVRCIVDEEQIIDDLIDVTSPSVRTTRVCVLRK